jgi:hypothetical protein
MKEMAGRRLLMSKVARHNVIQEHGQLPQDEQLVIADLVGEGEMGHDIQFEDDSSGQLVPGGCETGTIFPSD